MKIISLWQPWASLVACGAKRFETRSWKTPYRGRLAIHAAKTWSYQLYNICRTEPFKTVLGKHGLAVPCWNGGKLPRPVAMPFGAIVAVAELTSCIPTSACRQDSDEKNALVISQLGDEVYWMGRNEWAFGDYMRGRFAWQLSGVQLLADPIACVGMQGLRDVPADIAGQVREKEGKKERRKADAKVP